MLILSRKAGEVIVIGENIRLHVLGVQGQHVRFGIDAPREIPVDRLEIYERKMAERANGHPALDRSLET